MPSGDVRRKKVNDENDYGLWEEYLSWTMKTMQSKKIFFSSETDFQDFHCCLSEARLLPYTSYTWFLNIFTVTQYRVDHF